MSKVHPNTGEDQAILNAKRYIAIHALSVGLDGKLLTNMQFKQQYNIVAGTMQRALAILKDTEALSTRSKGHLGRIVTQIDIGLCWNIAKLKPIQLLMPSSGSIEIDILIRHFTAKLSKLNIPYFISNRPGAYERIEKVNQGECDITLVSKGAAESSNQEMSPLQLKILAPDTYYSIDRLVIVSRTKQDKAEWNTIAIDSSSSDHTSFTECEFPDEKGYRYFESNFRQIPARVLKEEIDAGIWHITGSPVPLSLSGLTATKLTNAETLATHKQISAATFITNPNRPELNSLLSQLNSKEIIAEQAKAFEQEDTYNKAF
ncbi:YhfZ family protein [Vibrio sp. FNV 38]|nr:YhfZ family protein [Vibrio sp. FNV 38]